MLLNKKIPVTFIFGRIKVEIIYTCLIWLLVYYPSHYLITDYPQLPITVPAFIGTAISIILSFKLNQSYNRWWEARIIWGNIANESRAFVFNLQSLVKPTRENDIRTLAYRQIAWCFSLSQSLRGLDAVENLDKYLSADDLKLISKRNNKPLAILQLNNKHIIELKNDDAIELYSQVQINRMLANFSNAMGMAERINSTVFPTTYRIFLH